MKKIVTGLSRFNGVMTSLLLIVIVQIGFCTIAQKMVGYLKQLPDFAQQRNIIILSLLSTMGLHLDAVNISPAFKGRDVINRLV
jgi:hypothetical protein